ncbi:MAG: ATP-binding protein [Usitatibacteraceae bacterium]
MELFALTDEVVELEDALRSLRGPARLTSLIGLAWQLRQRDCRRALVLADEAEVLLQAGVAAGTEERRAIARLRLVRGETRWLFADLETAERDARTAIETFTTLGDHVGTGDGQWVLASILIELGKGALVDPCIDAAIEQYRAAGDQVRLDTAVARRLLRSAFRDAHATAAGLNARFSTDAQHNPTILGWLASARAIVAVNTGDSGEAIKQFVIAYHAAMACGQIRLAVVSASNAADTFSSVGDFDAALEWVENALAPARSNGSPGFLALPLMQNGNILRLLGRYAEASANLSEALTVLGGLKNSQSYGIVSEYLGDLSLDMGDPTAALNFFREAEQYYAEALEGPIPLLRCWRGQADALRELGEPEQAMAKLSAALELAEREKIGVEHIRILRVYAELYQHFPLPLPADMKAPSATLHFLLQALALANSIDDYVVPGEMLDEIANAYAAIGDFRSAFAHAQAAASAGDSKQLRDARNRAIAMQVRQETEQAHAEAQYQRQLANTEAARAVALQEASTTLETLGTIGREITASLDADAVFTTLYRHVNNLLDATSFDVYLLEQDGRELVGVFGIEDSRPSPLIRIPVDDPTSFTARCLREREEVVVNKSTIAEDVECEVVPGTLDTLSLIFAPLAIGERLLGVMTIQSVRAYAYGERERSIFRTLCAYGAIALDNSAAYALAERARQQADSALAELREAEARRAQAEAASASLESQLRESQKMEAIGTLAGGIAHDFNNILATILGNAELAREDVSANPQAMESLGEIKKAGTRARDLVQQILSFSRRQPTERAQVALAPVIEESIRLLRATLPARLTLEVHCDPTVPAVLADVTQIQQVVINLATNAMQAMHGGPGRIDIRLDTVMLDAVLAQTHSALRAMHAQSPGRAVRLTVRDNGRGMDAATVGRIFEPFFTTKAVDEGTGLGLSVVHGIVRGHEGAIVVESELGRGSTFTIYLPSAPADSAAAVPESAATTAAVPSRDAGRHILYLDDDESLVFLVKRLLERRGYRVSGFTEQREALDALRVDPASFDLVVTDYNMPGMSGLDVAREVRAVRSDVPVAIASGFIDESLRAQACGAGVRELIFKANAVEEFCETFVRLAQPAEKTLPA